MKALIIFSVATFGIVSTAISYLGFYAGGEFTFYSLAVGVPILSYHYWHKRRHAKPALKTPV